MASRPPLEVWDAICDCFCDGPYQLPDYDMDGQYSPTLGMRRALMNLRLVSRTVERAASRVLFEEVAEPCTRQNISELSLMAQSRHAPIVRNVIILNPSTGNDQITTKDSGKDKDQVKSATRSRSRDIVGMVISASSGSSEGTTPRSNGLTLSQALQKFKRIERLAFVAPFIEDRNGNLSQEGADPDYVPRLFGDLRVLLERLEPQNLKTLSLQAFHLDHFDYFIRDICKPINPEAHCTIAVGLKELFDRLSTLALSGISCPYTIQAASAAPGAAPRSHGIYYVASLARNAESLSIHCDIVGCLTLPPDVELASGAKLRYLDLPDTIMSFQQFEKMIKSNSKTIDNIARLSYMTERSICDEASALEILSKVVHLTDLPCGILAPVIAMSDASLESDFDPTLRKTARKLLAHCNKNRRKAGLHEYVIASELKEEEETLEGAMFGSSIVDEIRDQLLQAAMLNSTVDPGPPDELLMNEFVSQLLNLGV